MEKEKTAKTTKIKIVKGNFFMRVVDFEKVGYEIMISQNGEEYYFFYYNGVVCQIEPVEIFPKVKVLWKNLPTSIKEKYFYCLFPNGSIEQMREFVGTTKGNEIEDKSYEKARENERNFGRRANQLAKKLDVPWEIVLCIGYIESDEEIIDIINYLKDLRANLNDEQTRKLSLNNIAEKNEAIKAVLGKETFEKFKLTGPKRIENLAKYLLGEKIEK